MTFRKPFSIALVTVFLSAGLSFTNQARGTAGAAEGHQHHDMQYEHTRGSEGPLVDIKTDPGNIIAGSPVVILLALKDHKGDPVEDLAVHHDRLLHVVIASEDFTVFSHIHPEDFGPVTAEMRKTARYPVRFTFPKAGRYIIGIDFSAKGQLYSRHFLVEAAGGPAMGAQKKDLSREKRFEELDVTFAGAPEPVKAGQEATLSYVFRKNGEPVADLEPWLSAPMHLAIIPGGLTDFVHTHGEIPGMAAMQHHEHHMQMTTALPQKFGPRVEVHIVFPAKGLYQVFGQVGYHGKVIATSFMVEVE